MASHVRAQNNEDGRIKKEARQASRKRQEASKTAPG